MATPVTGAERMGHILGVFVAKSTDQREKLAEAKSGLGEITQQWTEAAAAAQGGKLTDAIAKATAVKTRAADVLTMLGMPVPDALKS